MEFVILRKARELLIRPQSAIAKSILGHGSIVPKRDGTGRSQTR